MWKERSVNGGVSSSTMSIERAGHPSSIRPRRPEAEGRRTRLELDGQIETRLDQRRRRLPLALDPTLVKWRTPKVG